MTEKLAELLEFGAHENFGSIVGSFVLDGMPDVYGPDDVPADFVKSIVGIQLPIRGKLNNLYDRQTAITHNVADTIIAIQSEADRPIRVYGMDAIAELERLGRVEDVARWERNGWIKLGFTAGQGTLAPLPHLLAA